MARGSPAWSVGAALERREYDIMKGEARTPELLGEVNGNGCVPVLQIGAHIRTGRAYR